MSRAQVERKRGQKLAAENMTKTQKLARELQSGQIESELRTVQEAIHLARGLFTQIESEGFKHNQRLSRSISRI